jgi:small-conductance mechanosensitive channel
MIEILLANFDNILITLVNLLPKIFAGILIFFATIYAGKAAAKIIKKILSGSDISEIHTTLYLRVIKIFFFFIAVVLFLGAVGLKSVAAGLFAGGGVITVVMGFAFREIGENLFAGILLSFNRPFKKGDLIKSQSLEGVVKSIDIRSTHIRSYDGQDIFIPSSQIYKNPLINYTKDGLRRFTLNITISHDSDVEMACDIIDQEIGKVKGVLKTPKHSVSLNQILPNYLEFSLYFWVNVFSSNNNVGKITTQIGSRVIEELTSAGFTLSSDVSSNVNFKIAQDIAINDGLAH